MSVPDISLLVPLAEQLNVTVAELLQGCRVEEEQRFTREETEELIRKALTFSAEPPERRQARTQKFLPLYGVSVVLGLVETAAVWAVGLAGTEGAMMLLIINVIFGIVYGAYTLFWMPETLPRYYDENHVCNFAQGAFHMHIPGVYYNNRNWLHVLKAMRVWCVVSMLLTPLCTEGAVQLERATGWQAWAAVLSPVLLRRAQAKLWQALYYHYDYAQPWLPQLEANLHGLKADWAKLTAYQQKQNVQSK